MKVRGILAYWQPIHLTWEPNPTNCSACPYSVLLVKLPHNRRKWYQTLKSTDKCFLFLVGLVWPHCSATQACSSIMWKAPQRRKGEGHLHKLSTTW